MLCFEQSWVGLGMNYRKKGRKKKKELWAIYSFSMGHIEENTCYVSQTQLEDVGPDRA